MAVVSCRARWFPVSTTLEIREPSLSIPRLIYSVIRSRMTVIFSTRSEPCAWRPRLADRQLREDASRHVLQCRLFTGALTTKGVSPLRPAAQRARQSTCLSLRPFPGSEIPWQIPQELEQSPATWQDRTATAQFLTYGGRRGCSTTRGVSFRPG